jgi:molecular chaperone GrpE
MGSDTKGPLEADEYEVDGSENLDLEAAMREALEAVEATHTPEEEVDVDTAASPERAPDTELDETETAELAMLRREVVELRERSVRTLADFDNFRKRAERERDEQRRYAGSAVLKEVLPVVDNLERALESAGELGELKAGVELILRQILDLLRRNGVHRVEAMNQPFDPVFHEAVSRKESDDIDVPTVCDELQAGFLMKDRLLRPSMVVVAVPTQEKHDDEGSE